MSQSTTNPALARQLRALGFRTRTFHLSELAKSATLATYRRGPYEIRVGLGTGKSDSVRMQTRMSCTPGEMTDVGWAQNVPRTVAADNVRAQVRAVADMIEAASLFSLDHYTEVNPCGPQVGGDTGGDGQVGESWERRFCRRLPDRTYAVITTYFYVYDDAVRRGDEDVAGTELTLARQTEFLVCADPYDPGSTEVLTGDITYVDDVEGEATEAGAKAACEALKASDYVWNGTDRVRYDQIH